MDLFRKIDTYLSSITMYRLVLYGLSILAVISEGASLTGLLSLSSSGMIISFVTLVAVCYGANRLLSRYWQATSNAESSLITALILGFILPQATSVSRWLAVILAGVIAMASKYLFAVRNKHIFNPAAIAAVILGITNILPATWWIGSTNLLPFMIIFGLLLLRKLRRFQMFSSFLIASLVVTTMISLGHQQSIGAALKLAFTSSPLIFLGTVMLTEPLTTPPRSRQQLVYGVLVGVIFSAQIGFGRISSTPELALVIGNIFSYLVSPKYKLQLRLKEKIQMSAHVFDYIFTPDRHMAFAPGQYMEWTLPVDGTDSRGNRRTEPDIHLGIRFAEKSSRFKSVLQTMQAGDVIMGGQLAGNFILPKDTGRKLVFIAGGIGITPFRSMLQHMVDTKTKRDIVLFYMVSDPSEVSYKEVLSSATNFGLKVVPVLSNSHSDVPASWKGETGYLTEELLRRHVPDYAERAFYLSGPTGLVNSYTKLLHSLKISDRAIVKDFFSGY
jgi:ferredoxin-NADP reductase/Na+-translocating ferredoxin:NAD+ oxidoreductase RnfD subunit